MCLFKSLSRYLANRDPKKLVHIGHPLSVTFTLVSIAFFFVVQVFYVAPHIFGHLQYKIFWLIAMFIIHNILGNMLACHRTKSSVACLPEARKLPASGEEHLWHYCKTCETMMPPRSWHCKLCNVCILKRDHHCTFTATCIGHNNHRYFFWFIFYLFLGSLLCLVTTTILLAANGSILLLGFGMPLGIIKYWKTPSLLLGFLFDNLFLALHLLPLIAISHMLLLEAQFVYKNTTFFRSDLIYDVGFRENMLMVMGQRGLWTMLSPAMKSPLPHDGTQWRTKEDQEL